MRSKQLFISKEWKTCTAVCCMVKLTTNKGNEPDGRKIDYTDKGEGVKSPEKNKFFSCFDADTERGIPSLDV